MIDTKLEEIRAAVAECNVVKDGSTHETRQRENARRIRVFKKLDAHAQDLQRQLAAAAASNEDTSRIEVTCDTAVDLSLWCRCRVSCASQQAVLCEQHSTSPANGRGTTACLECSHRGTLLWRRHVYTERRSQAQPFRVGEMAGDVSVVVVACTIRLRFAV